MPNDVTGSSPEGVSQGSPPEGATTDSPSEFGKSAETSDQTVPLQRLQQVINQKKGAEEQISQLRAEIEQLKSQPQVAAPQANPAVGNVDLSSDIISHQNRMTQALQEGNEAAAVQASYAMAQTIAQNTVNETLADIVAKDAEARQQQEYKSLHNQFLDKMAQDFPDMADQNSDLYKSAVQIWQQDPSLQSSPRGEYDAAAHAALQMARGGNLPPGQPGNRPAGNVQLMDGSNPLSTAPPPSDSADLRSRVGEDGGLDAFIRQQIEDGIIPLPPGS